jgi:hypothetical protein
MEQTKTLDKPWSSSWTMVGAPSPHGSVDKRIDTPEPEGDSGSHYYQMQLMMMEEQTQKRLPKFQREQVCSSKSADELSSGQAISLGSPEYRTMVRTGLHHSMFLSPCHFFPSDIKSDHEIRFPHELGYTHLRLTRRMKIIDGLSIPLIKTLHAIPST